MRKVSLHAQVPALGRQPEEYFRGRRAADCPGRVFNLTQAQYIRQLLQLKRFVFSERYQGRRCRRRLAHLQNVQNRHRTLMVQAGVGNRAGDH